MISCYVFVNSLVELQLTGALFVPQVRVFHGGYPISSMEIKARVVHVWSVWQLEPFVLWSGNFYVTIFFFVRRLTLIVVM